MDYDKYLAKSKENFNELEQIKKDAKSMESAMLKPKMKQIDSEVQDSTQENNENQDLSIQDSNKENSFVYKTQGTQSISELRRQLNEILDTLINQEFINKQTGLVATIKKDDINKISSKEAYEKSERNSYSVAEHFEVAKDITNLYESATLKTTHLDSKERPNVANVHRFNNSIEVNKKETIAKITVFERIEGPNRIYSLELQVAPSPKNLSVQEIGMAKSLSSEPSAHTNSPNIANFVVGL